MPNPLSRLWRYFTSGHVPHPNAAELRLQRKAATRGAPQRPTEAANRATTAGNKHAPTPRTPATSTVATAAERAPPPPPKAPQPPQHPARSQRDQRAVDAPTAYAPNGYDGCWSHRPSQEEQQRAAHNERMRRGLMEIRQELDGLKLAVRCNWTQLQSLGPSVLVHGRTFSQRRDGVATAPIGTRRRRTPARAPGSAEQQPAQRPTEAANRATTAGNKHAPTTSTVATAAERAPRHTLTQATASETMSKKLSAQSRQLQEQSEQLQAQSKKQLHMDSKQQGQEGRLRELATQLYELKTHMGNTKGNVTKMKARDKCSRKINNLFARNKERIADAATPARARGLGSAEPRPAPQPPESSSIRAIMLSLNSLTLTVEELSTELQSLLNKQQQVKQQLYDQFNKLDLLVGVTRDINVHGSIFSQRQRRDAAAGATAATPARAPGSAEQQPAPRTL